jgi:hypothetical protein
MFLDTERARYERLRPLMRPEIKKPGTPKVKEPVSPDPETPKKKIVWADEIGLNLTCV